MEAHLNEQSAGALELDEYRRIFEVRVEHLVSVDQPLVLISQPPRSGGTLMMRLLDGHPELHAMPHEFSTRFGRTGDLLGGVDEAWLNLVDAKSRKYFEAGYGQSSPSLNGDRAVHPFVLPTSLHRRLFDHLMGQSPATSEREVIDRYLTSFFNAWLDNANLYGEKRWVSAFKPRMIVMDKYRRYRELYPDGLTISIIRDPHSWFASARGWRDEWKSRRAALAVWREGVETILALAPDLGERLVVVSYTDLVTRPKEIMRLLAERLSIAFDRTLLVPTFNGRPIRANSSFPNASAQVSKTSLERWRKDLSADVVDFITRETKDLYAAGLGLRLTG